MTTSQGFSERSHQVCLGPGLSGGTASGSQPALMFPNENGHPVRVEPAIDALPAPTGKERRTAT